MSALSESLGWQPDGPFLRALAVRPGERREGAAEQVAAGRYEAAQMTKDGYHEVAVSDRPLRETLLATGRAALAAGQIEGGDLGLILHSAIHPHGYEGLWQPVAALQHHLDAAGALGWSMSYGCNGQALGLIQSMLLMPRLKRPALVVGADRFAGTSFERWRSDRGLVYGDAVTAAVLDPGQGFARIVYADVEFAPELEALHGGLAPLAASGADAWDVTRTKRAYFEQHGSGRFFEIVGGALSQLRDRLDVALAAAGVRVDAVVTPFVGRSMSRGTYEAVFCGYAPARTSIAFGMRMGHTGTSDQLLGLAHHLHSARLSAGAHILLIGAGAGFGVSALVVRLERQPTLLEEGLFA